MKNEITIGFIDFWIGFDINNNPITHVLKSLYTVHISTEITEDIDILFCSLFNNNADIKKYHNLKVIKVFITPENDFPDWNIYDYSISMSDIEYYRNLRLPHWVWYAYNRNNNVDRIYHNSYIDSPFFGKEMYNRKDGCFVVSNFINCDKTKINIINTLWKNMFLYSGGKDESNNVGGPVENKIEFTKNYKFEIACENSYIDGYVTEKIYEAFVANTIPIYWGSDYVKKDFNPKSFIYVNDYPSIDAMVKDVVDIKNNPDRYLEILNTPRFCNYNYYIRNFIDFLMNIVENGKIFNKDTGTLSYYFYYKFGVD